MTRAIRCLGAVCAVAWLALRAIVVRTGWVPPARLPAVQWVLMVAASFAALALLFLGALGARRATRSIRASRDPWLALGQGLSVPLSRPAAALAVFQVRLWASLLRWLVRRVPGGSGVFSYAERTAWRGALAAAVGVAAVSGLIAILAIPPGSLRVVVIAALAWALTSLLGAYASLVVHPHTYDDDELVLRYGVLAAARIPATYIVAVEPEHRQNPEQRRSGARITKNGGAVSLAHRGRTDVTLRLRTPVSVRRLTDRTAPVMTLRAAVDDPERFVEEVRPSGEPDLPPGGVHGHATNVIERLWSTQRV